VIISLNSFGIVSTSKIPKAGIDVAYEVRVSLVIAKRTRFCVAILSAVTSTV
jgi:hypothetical protein